MKLPKEKVIKIILLSYILVFFLGNVCYGFPDSPAPWGDEGINLGIVKSWIVDGVFSLSTGPGKFVQDRPLLITSNYPILLPIALSFKLFGLGMAQSRIVMVLFLIGFLFSVYFFIKKYTSEIPALMSLAAIVSFLPFYGNGMVGGMGEIPGLTYLFLSFLVLKEKSNKRVFYSGLLFGLAIATKPLFLPILFFRAVIDLYYYFFHISKYSLKEYAIFWGAATAPLVIWFFTLYPSSISLSLLKNTAVFYSNPLDTHGTFFTNVLKFISETTPLHFIFLFFVILYSYRYIMTKFNKIDVYVLTLFIIADIAYFLRSPGWYRYFFPAHMLLLVFIGPAFFGIIDKFKKRGNYNTMVRKCVCIFFIIFLLVQSVHLYRNRNSALYYNPSTRMTVFFIESLRLAENDKIFLIDASEVAFSLTGHNIYQNLFINTYLRAGDDLFKTSSYPKYVITKGSLEKNDYTANYIDLFYEKYMNIFSADRYVVYQLDTREDLP